MEADGSGVFLPRGLSLGGEEEVIRGVLPGMGICMAGMRRWCICGPVAVVAEKRPGGRFDYWYGKRVYRGVTWLRVEGEDG